MWSPATREPRAASARDYDVLKYGTLLCVLFRSYAELHVTDSPCAALLYPLQQHMCWRRGDGAGVLLQQPARISVCLFSFSFSFFFFFSFSFLFVWGRVARRPPFPPTMAGRLLLSALTAVIERPGISPRR